jgi:hypothetical protein
MMGYAIIAEHVRARLIKRGAMSTRRKSGKVIAFIGKGTVAGFENMTERGEGAIQLDKKKFIQHGLKITGGAYGKSKSNGKKEIPER